MGGAPQSHFLLRASSMLAVLLMLLFMCVLFLVFLLEPMWSSAVLGGFVLVAFAYIGARDARLLLVHSVVAFRLERENRITLIYRSGRHTDGIVTSDSLVTPFLILLHVKQEGMSNRIVVVMPDSMGGEAFRRLRVQLRWK